VYLAGEQYDGTAVYALYCAVGSMKAARSSAVRPTASRSSSKCCCQRPNDWCRVHLLVTAV